MLKWLFSKYLGVLPKRDNSSTTGNLKACESAPKIGPEVAFCGGYRDVEVVLYTREGCHLCDEAQEVLSSFGISPTVVDIDANPKLLERFDACVPVVEIDGQIRFRGRVEPKLLRRIVGHAG